MIYRIMAALFLILGIALGVCVVVLSGANTLTKQILGLLGPTVFSLIFVIAWWRKSGRA